MTDYCSTCGGLPHADGEELAGPAGHFTKYGRLRPIDINAQVWHAEEKTVLEDGPTMVSPEMPDGAPRNATWLAALDGDIKVVESKGVWQGKEQHYVGVAGKLSGDVSFYGSWKMAPKGWGSFEFWLRAPDVGVRKVKWVELKGAVRELVHE